MTNSSPVTITFLCIDMQSRLSEASASPSQGSLEHYTTILYQAIKACDGSVFKSGDGLVYTAFTTPQAALAAALASYWTMHTKSWGDAATPHVRMALHTGPAGRYSTTYVGPTFNHAVSLLAACSSGQILLSHDTYEQVSAQLPAGSELRDIGEHRLKDLTRPEHIFLLIPHHRPADLPTNAAPAPFPVNMPVLPSPLIGRDREVAELRNILRRLTVRQVTLLGSSGTGKTRLSLQLAVEMASEFDDGVYFVPLAPIGSADLVLSAIAQALDLKETGEQPLQEAITSYLSERQMLLILDNFEQLLAAAPLINQLLEAAPRLKILVTSQAKLSISSEYVYPVPPLALPNPERLPPLSQLATYPSIALFLVRAQVVHPDFTLTKANAAIVAELCVLLGGIPLAIELVAAYSDLFEPDEMRGQIKARLAAQQQASGAELSHKQTLHEALGWSYGLLGPDEQRLLARMGIFEGGCTLEAVNAVCNPSSDIQSDIQRGAARLLSKNLLVQEEWLSPEPRYVMLDMIHQFAGAQLSAHGETDLLAQSHASYMMALAEKGEAGLLGAEQDAWLKRLEDDLYNMRAALEWADQRQQFGTALKLSGSLWRFWYMRGHLSEGRRWLTSTLTTLAQHPGAVQPEQCTKAITGASVLSFVQGDYTQARGFAEQNLAIFRQLGDQRGIANTLSNLGAMAIEYSENSVAKAALTESLQLRREISDTWGIAAALNNLAQIYDDEGDHTQAEAYYTESLETFRSLSDTANSVNPMINLGWLLLLQGRHAESQQLFTEAIKLTQELGYLTGSANALLGLARIAVHAANPTLAAQLIGLVDTLHQQSDVQLTPLDQERYSRIVKEIRTTIDLSTYQRAWEKGQSWGPEQAIAAFSI